MLDGLDRGNITFENVCFTNTTHSSGRTIKIFGGVGAGSSIDILACNYKPPKYCTQIDITFNFTIYDENISSEFLLKLLIGNNEIQNNSHKYEQKYKMFSTNQTNVYSKTFYLTVEDILGNGNKEWNNNTVDISFRFSSGPNIKYLFISDRETNITNYTIDNVQLPSIEINPKFY